MCSSPFPFSNLSTVISILEKPIKQFFFKPHIKNTNKKCSAAVTHTITKYQIDTQQEHKPEPSTLMEWKWNEARNVHKYKLQHESRKKNSTDHTIPILKYVFSMFN